MAKVWTLFKDLDGISLEQAEKLYSGSDSHTLNIVRSALNGSISLSDESVKNFNLFAYEHAARVNDVIGKRKKALKELHIVEFDNSDDDITVGFGDVSDRKLSFIDDSFDTVMNCDEFEFCIRELGDIRTKYIVENGLDVVNVLIRALKCSEEAIKELKNLISVDDRIKDLVVSLCELGGNRLLYALEGMASC